MLVVKVHDLVKNQQIPKELVTDDIWKDRYRQIRDYERYLHENGIIVVKFFLHISKDEQKKRLLARIDDKSKNWKFSAADIVERQFWDNYQNCYQAAISETSTKNSPWYVVPSNKKWYSRLVISEAIVQTMEKLNLEYPKLGESQKQMLQKCKIQLEKE